MNGSYRCMYKTIAWITEYYQGKICNALLACTNMQFSDLSHAYKTCLRPRLIMSQGIMFARDYVCDRVSETGK